MSKLLLTQVAPAATCSRTSEEKLDVQLNDARIHAGTDNRSKRIAERQCGRAARVHLCGAQISVGVAEGRGVEDAVKLAAGLQAARFARQRNVSNQRDIEILLRRSAHDTRSGVAEGHCAVCGNHGRRDKAQVLK